jgi:hypothetical protein
MRSGSLQLYRYSTVLLTVNRTLQQQYCIRVLFTALLPFLAMTHASCLMHVRLQLLLHVR